MAVSPSPANATSDRAPPSSQKGPPTADASNAGSPATSTTFQGPWHEVLPVPFPIRRETQRRGLDATRGEHLPVGSAFDREESREDGAPREVDPLPGRRGIRQGPIRLDEILEGAMDLGCRHRAEAGPPCREIRILTAKGLEGLDADQLPLSVVVRREDDLVDRVRETAERVMQRGGRLLPDGLQVDQGIEIGSDPILGRLRIVDLDDVTSEREHDDVVPAGREREVAGDVCPDLLSHPF